MAHATHGSLWHTVQIRSYMYAYMVDLMMCMVCRWYIVGCREYTVLVDNRK